MAAALEQQVVVVILSLEAYSCCLSVPGGADSGRTCSAGSAAHSETTIITAGDFIIIIISFSSYPFLFILS